MAERRKLLGFQGLCEIGVSFRCLHDHTANRLKDGPSLGAVEVESQLNPKAKVGRSSAWILIFDIDQMRKGIRFSRKRSVSDSTKTRERPT